MHDFVCPFCVYFALIKSHDFEVLGGFSKGGLDFKIVKSTRSNVGIFSGDFFQREGN